MPPVPPLIGFLAGVLTDPAELAAFRRAPAVFLAENGYEGIDDDDAVEALALVADTMPPAVAAGLTQLAEVSPGDRLDARYDVGEGFDDALQSEVEAAVIQGPDPVAEAEREAAAVWGAADLDAWVEEEPALPHLAHDPEPAEHLAEPADGFDELDAGLPPDVSGELGGELGSPEALGGFEGVADDLRDGGLGEGSSEAADIGLF